MSILDEIIVGVREDLAERQRRIPVQQLAGHLAYAPPALDPMPAFGSGPISVLAEVKRASPSKGELAEIADPAALAEGYAAGGAAAISVLTEARRFRGSLADLVAVRDRVEVPLLRKDFVVTEYQLIEGRVAGADLALLIVAALDDAQLADLHQAAGELGLTCLVEVHDEAEVERALNAGTRLLGVNNRNLKTLEVDPQTFARLAPLVPPGVLRVAESGIRGPQDVTAARAAGADVVLVGEALVTGGDPAATVAEMIAAGA